MRRNFLALTMAALLALGACGGDDGGSSSADTTVASGAETDGAAATGSIEDAEDCNALVDAAQPIFATAFQDLIDQASDMNAADLAEAGANPESSQLIEDFTAKLQADGEAIEKKADDLGCSDEDGQRALCGAVDQLDTKGNVLAESMVQSMAADC
jgi:hypothetical protein